MTESVPQDQMEAARAYEALMVPALFGEWAPRVADAVQAQSGQCIMDVACGTGILARTLASRLGSGGGNIIGVDPAEGMLAVARQAQPAVEWLTGVAESLPVSDESVDILVSQFGLMFFDDRPQALREVIRVLRPGGRLAIAVWDTLEQNPAYADEACMVELLAGAAAANGIRAPFVLGDRGELQALFETAGVEDLAITTWKGAARFPNVRTMVEADLRGWLPLLGVNLTEELIETILQKAESIMAPYVARDGSASFETSAHIVTGRR